MNPLYSPHVLFLLIPYKKAFLPRFLLFPTPSLPNSKFSCSSYPTTSLNPQTTSHPKFLTKMTLTIPQTEVFNTDDPQPLSEQPRDTGKRKILVFLRNALRVK